MSSHDKIPEEIFLLLDDDFIKFNGACYQKNDGEFSSFSDDISKFESVEIDCDSCNADYQLLNDSSILTIGLAKYVSGQNLSIRLSDDFASGILNIYDGRSTTSYNLSINDNILTFGSQSFSGVLPQSKNIVINNITYSITLKQNTPYFYFNITKDPYMEIGSNKIGLFLTDFTSSVVSYSGEELSIQNLTSNSIYSYDYLLSGEIHIILMVQKIFSILQKLYFIIFTKMVKPAFSAKHLKKLIILPSGIQQTIIF